MSKLMLVNPRKRRAPKRRVTKRRTARRTTMSRVTRRRRRNPVRRKGIMGDVMGNMVPAATAATGGIALDLIWGYAPIPANLKAGPLRHVVKAAGAIGLGMLAGMVVNKDTANRFATGALTVTMHAAMRDMIGKAAPNIKLGDVDEFDDLGYSGSGFNPDDGMAEYLAAGVDDDYIGNDDIDGGIDDGVGAYLSGDDDDDLEL